MKEIRDLINRIESCLDDDFNRYYENDIMNWVNDLIEIYGEIKLKELEKGE